MSGEYSRSLNSDDQMENFRASGNITCHLCPYKEDHSDLAWSIHRELFL